MESMNISQILREEIDRYLITEDLTQLSKHRSNLMKYANQLVNYCTGLDKRISSEIDRDLLEYTYQIVHAIKRCMVKDSLFEYRNWGIQLPPELGGNIRNHFRQGYYYTRNLLGGGQSNANMGSGGENVPQKYGERTLQTVKLSALLQQLGTYQGKCNVLIAKYPQQLNGNIGFQMNKILKEIGNTSQTYNQLVAMQQQNQQQQQQTP